MRNMKHHPLVRTSQDIRRALARLQSFIESPLATDKDDIVAAQNCIVALRDLQQNIPEKHRNADLATREG